MKLKALKMLNLRNRNSRPPLGMISTSMMMKRKAQDMNPINLRPGLNSSR